MFDPVRKLESVRRHGADLGDLYSQGRSLGSAGSLHSPPASELFAGRARSH